MRAKDFIKEDHGFLAPGSHNWEKEVGKNVWNYLKNLPSGAWDGFKNVTGIGDSDDHDDHDHDESNMASPTPLELAQQEARKKRAEIPPPKRQTLSNLRSSRTGRTSRTGRSSRTGRISD